MLADPHRPADQGRPAGEAGWGKRKAEEAGARWRQAKQAMRKAHGRNKGRAGWVRSGKGVNLVRVMTAKS